MNDALTIFDVEHEQQDSELKKTKTEMLLIQVRYYAAFANIFYVMGSYTEAKVYVEKALEIC